MNKIILALVVCLGFVGYLSAAVSRAKGACPNGINPGKSWYPEGCKKCDCIKGGYTCYTCDTLDFPAECKATYDTTKKYPDCCVPKLDCPQN